MNSSQIKIQGSQVQVYGFNTYKKTVSLTPKEDNNAIQYTINY